MSQSISSKNEELNNTENIKISVIIPIYNAKKHLERCLDSVINQTLKEIEIICIVDGSFDASLNIVQEFSKKDERIISIFKKNEGYGASCNLGLDKARGEYISIIEPDDYIYFNMFENLYKIAQNYDSDIVKSPYYDNLQAVIKRKIKKINWNEKKIPQKKSFEIKRCPLFLFYDPSIWSAIYKTSFLKENNIYFIEAQAFGGVDNLFQIQTMILAKKINYTKNVYYFRQRTYENLQDSIKDWKIPFERYKEINEWLDEKDINEPEILACLWAREINCIKLILEKRYSKEEQQKIDSKIQEMLDEMDGDIILNSVFVPKQIKKSYKSIEKNLAFYRFKVNIKNTIKNIFNFAKY